DAADEEATNVAATGRIEGGGGLGVNGQATGKTNTAPEIAQSCGVPTSPAVSALVNAPDVRTVVFGPHARVESGGGLGVDRQGGDILGGPDESRRGVPAPALQVVRALEDPPGCSGTIISG